MPQWKTFTPIIHSAILCIPLFDAFYLANWLGIFHISVMPFLIQTAQKSCHNEMPSLNNHRPGKNWGMWPKIKASRLLIDRWLQYSPYYQV